MAMGCRRLRFEGNVSPRAIEEGIEPLSFPAAIFRLNGGRGRRITMEVALGAEAPLAADIVFRNVQRLGQAVVGRLERLEESAEEAGPAATVPADPPARPDPIAPAPAPRRIGRIATLLTRIGVTSPTATERLAGPHTPARP